MDASGTQAVEEVDFGDVERAERERDRRRLEKRTLAELVKPVKQARAG